MNYSDALRSSGHAEQSLSPAPTLGLERTLQLLEGLPEAIVLVDAEGHITLVNHHTEALFGYARADLLGQPIERLIPGRFRRAHRRHRARYAAVPVARPMGEALEVLARRQDGREFPVEVSLSPLPATGLQDRFAVLAIIRDISALRQAERAKRDAEAATAELRRVQAITDVALSHQTLDELLPAILIRLCAVLQMDNAAILLLEPDERTLTVRAVHGLEEAVAAGVRVPLGQGFAGRIAASRAPLVVDDLSTFPVVNLSLREQLRSVLGVPLLVDDRLLGVLHSGTATPRHFTERDVRLLQLVAERLALAIDRARLHDAEQAALADARQSERRFARLVAGNLIGVSVAEGDRLIEANDAFLQLVGYTRADLEAGRLRWPEMTPPEYAPLSQRALAEVRERGACTPFEMEYVRKDESRVPILTGVVRVEEYPERHAAFVVDLSERRRLQQALSTYAGQLEATFQALHDGVVIIDMAGQVVLANEAMARTYGYASAERIQRELASFAEEFDLAYLDGRPLPVAEGPASRVLRGEAFADWELRVRRRDTGQAWIVSCSGKPVRDVAGRQVLAVVVTRDLTERERLTRAVAERAQQLEVIMGAMVDGVVVYDAEGRIAQVNAAARTLLALDAAPDYVTLSQEERARLLMPRDAAGRPLPREQRPQARLLRGEVLSGATIEDLILRGLDGRDRQVSVTGAPLRDAAGMVTGAVASLRDVTTLRQLEREARALAAQLQTTFDAMADLVFLYDVSGRLLRMNPAALALLGLANDAEEVAYASRPVAERTKHLTPLTPDGQPFSPDAFPISRVLRGEMLIAAEPQDVRLTDADGRERVLSFTGGPVRDAVGTRLGYVTVGHDVTARWQLEQQVRFQASLLERTHDAIFVWELGGPLVFWNQGAELLYGYRADEALGKVAHALLRTRLPEPVAAFEARLRQEGEWMGELTHTARDGRVVEVLSRLQVLRADGLPRPPARKAAAGDADGGPGESRLYVCESARDITEYRRLERARAEAEAREGAIREINQHLDEFFSIAAHDIRNPVTVVNANAQLARRRFEKLLAAAARSAPATGGSSAEAAIPARAGMDRSRTLTEQLEAVRESLEVVQQSTDHLARLTTQLFDVARARTGTLELDLAPCDLVALVREQVTAQRLATPERTIAVEVPEERPAVLVQADADRLGEVLANYLTNALKYSSEDRPVTVGVEVTAGQAVVWVRDRGPGLPWVEQSQVWDLLHRAPTVHVRSRLGKETGSLGLGLHICKRIIELHPGGRVGVESEEGEGATFWFRLPLLAADDEREHQGARP
jgi:PAS domain S-box-containing protein